MGARKKIWEANSVAGFSFESCFDPDMHERVMELVLFQGAIDKEAQRAVGTKTVTIDGFVNLPSSDQIEGVLNSDLSCNGDRIPSRERTCPQHPVVNRF